MAKAVAGRAYDSLRSGGYLVLECGDGRVGGADRLLRTLGTNVVVLPDRGGRKGLRRP
jgi:hypothetical protein